MFQDLADQLLQLYRFLGGGILVGLIAGRILPPIAPVYVGKFLFWFGIPISIVAFLRRAELSQSVWIAPAIAWIAIFFGILLAWGWIRLRQSARGSSEHRWKPDTQGSFLLTSMVGNTGYLGYPVALALVGEKYFAWALFYDLLGTVLGAYGLGVAIAARFGKGAQKPWQLTLTLLKNPILWGFGFGLVFRQVPLSEPVEQSFQKFAWTILALSLVLIGMRLSRLSSWQNLNRSAISLGIKMLLVPLVMGIAISSFGMDGAPRLIMVLQMSMPPAFATLVLAEAYDLDRQLTVTTLAVGTIGLLLTLPIWIAIFGVR